MPITYSSNEDTSYDAQLLTSKQSTAETAKHGINLRSEEKPIEKTSMGDAIGATVMLNNPITNWLNDPTTNRVRPKLDLSFDPFADEYKGVEHIVAKARNKDEADDLLSNFHMRERARQDLANAGTMTQLGATLVAGSLDPIDIALLLTTGGEGNALLRAARVGGAMAAGQTGKELLLHQNQAERTTSESVSNIVGAGLGGAGMSLGMDATKWIIKNAATGIARKMIGSTADTMPAEMASHAHDAVEQHLADAITPDKQFGSVGAAGVQQTDLASERLVGEGFLKNSQRALSGNSTLTGISPNEKLSLIEGHAEIDKTNPLFAKLRELKQKLAVDPYTRAKNLDGIATPHDAETIINRQHDTLMGSFGDLFNKEAKNFKANLSIAPTDLAAELRRVGENVTDAEVAANPSKYLTPGYLDRLVSGALRNGDESAITQVKNLAGWARQNILTPLGKEAMDRGMFNEAVQKATAEGDIATKAADSYMHRIYDKDRIAANEANFKAVVARWADHFGAENPQEVASDVFTQIMGMTNSLVSARDVNLIGKAAPLKERILAIPDNELAPFLVNSSTDVLDTYSRRMINDITFKDVFGDNNLTTDLAHIDTLHSSYQQQLETLLKSQGKSATQINAALEGITARVKEAKAELSWLNKVVQKKPLQDADWWTKTSATIKTYNAVTQLGSMLISNLSDIARQIAADGIAPWGKAFVRYTTSKEFRSITREEAKELGVGFEAALSTRIQSLYDYGLDNRFARKGMVAQGLDQVSQRFGKLTLMQYYTAFSKDLTGTILSNRLIRGIQSYAQLPKDELAFLASHGIDSDMASRVADQFAKHGETRDGFRFANTSQWDDEVARNAFANAAYKATNNYVIAPHAATLPKWMRTATGSLLGQFQSFTFAGHEQFLVAGLGQRFGAREAQGLVALGFLGAVQYQLKQLMSKGEVDSDPRSVVLAAVDATNIFGLPYEVGKRALAITGETPQTMLGITDQQKRFRDVNLTGQILGPGWGHLEDVSTIIKDATHGEWKDSDVHRARKLLPLQNLLWLRGVLDKAEQAIKE
ncbi:hypothetical protein Q9Q94_10325 [Uliginosibacterium sp. 31-16]|uniref:hypothetical protein n=1 Tax=Uliginosibacterium sp. 31-16 TaxID=3068315 RepID=UPI00273F1CD7|nr:hypothetical protein [Uliginosibacterium sp. 31-16]MDP5239931.1 hypothetical protein [Uliginosibacterium sp. 31-16]